MTTANRGPPEQTPLRMALAAGFLWLVAPFTVFMVVFWWLAGIEDGDGDRLYLEPWAANVLVGMLVSWIGAYVWIQQAGIHLPLDGPFGVLLVVPVAMFEVMAVALVASYESIVSSPWLLIAVLLAVGGLSFLNASRLRRGDSA